MPAQRHGKRRHWYLRGYVNGERYCESSGILIKGNAKNPPTEAVEADQALCNKIRQRQAAEAKGPVLDNLLLASVDALEHAFWAKKKRMVSYASMRSTYADNWKCLRRHIKTMDDCSTRAALEEYVVARRSTKSRAGGYISYATIKKELTVFYCGWDECVEIGVPMPKRPKRPDNLKKRETANQPRKAKAYGARKVRRFINALRSQHAKDKATLIAQTGLRDEEVARLHLVTKVLRRREGGLRAAFYLPPEATKKGKGRWVPLTMWAWKAWQRSVPFKARSVQTPFETASRRIGAKRNVTQRDLRASFATGVTDFGATDDMRNTVMGHAPHVSDTYQGATQKRLVEVATAAAEWFQSGRKKSTHGTPTVHLPISRIFGKK